nr:unnamed protein product [Callosobruchus analis]
MNEHRKLWDVKNSKYNRAEYNKISKTYLYVKFIKKMQHILINQQEIFVIIFAYFKCTSEVREILDVRLASLVDEVKQLFSNVRSEILEVATKKISSIEIPESSSTKSYSAVTRGSSAIMIQPKDAMQTVQATKADMLHHVNPVSENLQISGVKSAKNGGILIGCGSDHDSLKLKKIAAEKLADKYEVVITFSAM